MSKSNDPDSTEPTPSNLREEDKKPAPHGVHLTPKDAVSALCQPVAQGYIFSLANSMDYPVKFRWDIIDPPIGNDPQDQLKIKGYVTVPAKSIRYFTDGVRETHTIRIFSQNEFVDETLALESKKCTTDDTCDTLLRFCSQNRADQGDGEPNNDSYDAYLCQTYKTECNGFSKRKSDAKKDLEALLRAYFPSYFMGGVKSQTSTNLVSTALEMMADIDMYQKCKAVNGNFIEGTIHHTSTSWTAGAITAVVFMALLILIMLVLIICWILYCSPNYWMDKIRGTKKDQEGTVMMSNIEHRIEKPKRPLPQYHNIFSTNE